MDTIETIKIFIASSFELKEDRDDFRNFISKLNDRGHQKGVYFKLVQWEYFLDSVSETATQDDYNAALKNSQIVICLFYTKAGKYTQEEFDTALQQFKETGSPLIYTYFKKGAPVPDPNDIQALDLDKFKKRLEDIKHFYTSYNNIDDLKNQFRDQLDILEDKGFIKYKQEYQQAAKEAVTNYFNIKITNVENNFILQSYSAENITAIVAGVEVKMNNKFEEFLQKIQESGVKSFQSANTTYDVNSITKANFGFIAGQAGHDTSLPSELSQKLVGEGNDWIQSLKDELVNKHGLSVSSQPSEIFQNYGWLVDAFLTKMCTPVGQQKTLRRLSFMTEVYHASLRYLCYIQLSQIMQMESKPKLGIISDFIQMEGNNYLEFDYISLLLVTTDLLGGNGFMKEISKFVNDLNDTEKSLFSTVLFLQNQRKNLIANTIAEDDRLPVLLDEYLTALVYWLRKISFIGKYRQVSIKEISLNYSLGTPVNFIHLFGELNGTYTEVDASKPDNDDNVSTPKEEYKLKSVEGAFTYNKSILLFKGTDIASSMNNIQNVGAYLSLSPLIIDQSVYSGKPTQTPEIFYFTGYEKAQRQYNYIHCRKELVFGSMTEKDSNKSQPVLEQNNKQYRLNDLFEQLEEVFAPLKMKKS